MCWVKARLKSAGHCIRSDQHSGNERDEYNTMQIQKHCLIAAFITMMTSGAGAAAAEWKVAQPYPDNPSKTATLAGTGKFNDAQGQATFTVTCRPDAGMPVARLQISKMLAEVFPVAKFEGPGGIGENARLLQVKLDKENLTRSYFSTASYQEDDAFEWTFNPQKAELERWVNAAGKTMTLHVWQPASKTTHMQVKFQLPASSQPLQELITPCLNK